MDQTIDPVGTPDAYRASLLAALGDDDPAVVQADTPAALRALVTEAGDLLRVRPEPGEWSVLECIGHITDARAGRGGRERWILAEDGRTSSGTTRPSGWTGSSTMPTTRRS